MTYLHHDEPSRMAILVIDVQPVFVGLPLYPPVDGVLQRLRAFLDQAREAGATIVNVRVTIPKELFSDVWDAQFGTEFAQRIAPESPLTHFHPYFAPKAVDLVVVKTRYSAFIGTQLEAILRMRGITRLRLPVSLPMFVWAVRPAMPFNRIFTSSRLRIAPPKRHKPATKGVWQHCVAISGV